MSAATGLASGAGSFRLLLGHELRLWRRRVSDARQRWGRVLPLLLLVVALVLHGLAFGAVRMLNRVPERIDDALVMPLLGGAVVMLWSLLLAQGLTAATRAFFEAGAIDLIHTAPIPPGRIFATRAVAVAVITGGPFALFILPLAHMGVLAGTPSWLALYPVLAALSLSATAGGMALALLLVRVVGPRLTRTFGQVLAVLIGTGLGMAVQGFNHLPNEDKVSLLSAIAGDATGVMPTLGRMAAGLGRALTGELSALSWLGVGSVAIFLFAVTLLGPAFQRARALAGGSSDVRPAGERRAGRERAAVFGRGLAATLRWKELRLLTRDPWVLMPVMQRSIALVPTCLALAGLDSSGDLVLALTAPMLVVFAGKLAGGLAWLTLAAEEAPELIATAPVAAARIARAKVEAALIAMAALFGLPLMLLAMRDPGVAAATAVGCIAATGSATLLAMAEPRRNARRDFGDRFRNSAGFAVAELGVTMGWAAVSWCAVQGQVLAAAGIAASTLALLAGAVALLRGPRAAAPTVSRR